jgi:transposase
MGDLLGVSRSKLRYDSWAVEFPSKTQSFRSTGRSPVTIVGAFDVHRAQLTFEYLDSETGEIERGRVAPADRLRLRQWLTRFDGRDDVAFALEGCTGWRYVVEELQRVGIEAHLAEPADTAALRGNKRRAKTDRSDTTHLRTHLSAGDLPESWIPPAHVLEARVKIRLYKDLLDERGAWHQRVHAVLFHQGAPSVGRLMTADHREEMARTYLSPASRQAVEVGLGQIERLSAEMDPLKRELARLSRRQAGCRALVETHYGIGPITAVAIWAEMGDCRRFANSKNAVRHTGLDITVWSSDNKRSKGHLARQGPAVFRWALYEAAMCASRRSSPDHAYYRSVKDRRDGQLAAISVARKLARRCYHTLVDLGDAALDAA